jgi:hypothetical protein
MAPSGSIAVARSPSETLISAYRSCPGLSRRAGDAVVRFWVRSLNYPDYLPCLGVEGDQSISPTGNHRGPRRSTTRFPSWTGMPVSVLRLTELALRPTASMPAVAGSGWTAVVIGSISKVHSWSQLSSGST